MTISDDYLLLYILQLIVLLPNWFHFISHNFLHKCACYVTSCLIMYVHAQDSGQYRVEWLSTILQISKTTQGCWSGIFLGAQFPKIYNFGNARILFSKSHKALNLFLKICKKPSLYFKIQSPKIIFEIECWKEFFLQQLAKWLMI